MPWSHLHVKLSRNYLVAVTGSTWLLRGLHGCTGSEWHLRGLRGCYGSTWHLRVLCGCHRECVVITEKLPCTSRNNLHTSRNYHVNPVTTMITTSNAISRMIALRDFYGASREGVTARRDEAGESHKIPGKIKTFLSRIRPLCAFTIFICYCYFSISFYLCMSTIQ